MEMGRCYASYALKQLSRNITFPITTVNNYTNIGFNMK